MSNKLPLTRRYAPPSPPRGEGFKFCINYWKAYKMLKTQIFLFLLMILLGFWNAPLWAESGAKNVTYLQALPGYVYHFPRDHASHPDYKTEWWYYTGHLTTQQGQRLGYELTFFRIGTGIPDASPHNAWTLTNLYMTHFALSDPQHNRFYNTEKLNRGAMGLAGADTQQYHVWNQTWHSDLKDQTYHLFADSDFGKIQLALTPDKPLVIHGKDGISQKSSCIGCASHYYSFTRLQTQGTVMVNGQTEPVTGESWMDHEFGSNQLTANQVGWDWFAVQLSNHCELMLYRMRLKNGNGATDPNSSGSWVTATGAVQHLNQQDFQIVPKGIWKSPTNGALYPMGWEIRVPAQHLDLTITPIMNNQELTTHSQESLSYWEGDTNVHGSLSGQNIQGKAYVEMTGYAQSIGKRL